MKTPTKVLLVVLAVIVGLLLAIRFIGSPIATRFVNRKLAEMPKYTGHVESVQLALWRGTVRARHFILQDREKMQGPSLVVVDEASLTIALGPLFKGRLGGRGHITKMDVRIQADPPNKDDDDTPKPEPGAAREWQKALQQTFPIEVTRFEIDKTTVSFEDPYKKPVAKLTMDDFHLLARDFTNRSEGEEDMPAKVEVSARVGGSGRLAIEARVDPSAPQPKFYVKMDLQDLDLPPIHDFIAAYGLIDVRKGTFSVFSEINARGGHYQGYVKPFFKDLEFSAIPDPEKNIVQRAASKVASSVVDLLKNNKDQVATRAPIEGDFANNDVEVWATIENLLRNAFIQALREGLEGQTAAGG